MTTYRCELALLPDGEVAADVDVEVADGRIVAVRTGSKGTRADVIAPPGPDDDHAPGVGHVPGDGRMEHLPGLVVPGMANAHSHAFHRPLRGRTHGRRGTFWTWRDRMYDLAAALDPDRYRDLATAVFAEMALAGFSAVGEFHYLHHGPGGRRYTDPNEMGHAVVDAARAAGVRIALLDTCYLAGGLGPGGAAAPLAGTQLRFGDGDAAGWAARVEDLHRRHDTVDDVVVGAAVHSVRAVPRDQLPIVAAWARSRTTVLHAHVSEQPAENLASLDAYGRTPVQVLEEAGALGPHATAVHATHLTDDDVERLGASGTNVCFCPTTERDLADGIGPADRLVAAGATLTFGTDSHAVIDAFEEARATELHLRLATGERGLLPTGGLLRGLGAHGQRSLGFADAGALQVGARADLVAVDRSSVRTTGSDTAHAADTVVFAATAADVTDVIVDGRRIVTDRRHVLGDVATLLRAAIGDVTATDDGS